MAQSATFSEAPSKYHGKRMSLEEYEALPEEKPYLEYWDGVVIQKPVPRRRHWRLEGLVTAWLVRYAMETGGNAGPEAHVWFDGRGYRVPDVAYWSPTKDEGDDQRSLPPTLIVEIRSPDQSLTALREKCRQMRANGVDVCWLIEPYARRAEVFDSEADGAAFDANAVLTSDLLPGFELSLPELFAILDR
jgi:Uma2 family endonuclease